MNLEILVRQFVLSCLLKIKNNVVKNKKIKDHFIEDAFEKKQILDKIGFQYNNLRKVKVYIEQV